MPTHDATLSFRATAGDMPLDAGGSFSHTRDQAAVRSKTIVLIHGAWVTATSWETFSAPFKDAGFTVHTPTWPMLEGQSAEILKLRTPEGFGSLTVGRIVDHLEAFIRALPEPPILIGHSFGGLFTQMLLDRGVGVAGIAINPAPIAGIVPGPTSVTAILPAVLRWNGFNRPYAMSRKRWGQRFANTASDGLITASYYRFVIPTSGRILHQAATWLGTHVDPKRRTVPLLITGSDEDRLVTPYLSRAAYDIQRASAAPTDLKMFKGLSHFLIGEPGWENVADTCLDWVNSR